MKNRNKRGIIPLLLGVVLLLCAGFLTAYNIWDDHRAQTAVGQILENMVLPTQAEETEALPLYLQYPNMDMPVQNIDGNYYIGVLELPTLGLQLPVLSELTDYNLTISPCRYAGSAYLNNLIIGAHNYTSHFSHLRDLSYGDPIYFTDTDGNRFTYTVTEIELLSPTAVEEMKSGNWPLTLFTCTVGGASRVTVRCETAA